MLMADLQLEGGKMEEGEGEGEGEERKMEEGDKGEMEEEGDEERERETKGPQDRPKNHTAEGEGSSRWHALDVQTLKYSGCMCVCVYGCVYVCGWMGVYYTCRYVLSHDTT